MKKGGEKTHRGDRFPSHGGSALKIVYLRTAELNEKYSNRVMNGYYKCRYELKEMFSKRYP